MEVLNILEKEADSEYQKFASSLIPDCNNLIGVRLPVLRKIAKQIYKGNWQSFLNSKSVYFEELMLKGMVIGLLKCPPKEIIKHIKNFIPYINNWSICDSFCCSLKFTKENKEFVWNFLQKYLKSDNEFESRFGFVMLINYYVESDYITQIFEITEEFNVNKYYAQMAVAWLVSVCFIKYRDKTIDFLKHTKIDGFTYKKSLQKILESKYTDKSDKVLIKNLSTKKRNLS